MMRITLQQRLTSVACNRVPEIVDWNNDGLVCFGACNAVVLYDTEQKDNDSLSVFSHHQSRVNSVKWLNKSTSKCTELLSCSADKTAAIWTLDNDVWKVTSSLKGHTDAVTCVTGIYNGGDNVVVFTGSVDSTIRVWERKNGLAEHKQTINLNSGLCLTLHVHLLLTVNKPMLFCALDDHKIHIFTQQDEYRKVHTLVGHEDWVRGLDVLDVEQSTILIASASQDTYIRLWRMQVYKPDDRPKDDIRVEQKVFQAHGDWSVKLDAVLAGHEGWVYGVQWLPQHRDGKQPPTYRLLSSSLDKTLIIWEPDASSSPGEGTWTESVRVGEVGGNGLGFYGSRFGPDGNSFLGHGYNGSFHIWKFNKKSNQWQPSTVCGGHFNAVEDVRWDPRGRYIMSVSSDQTTRVHAPWRRSDGTTEWHELARPQVHGYDLCSLALVSSSIFASAAEEKVIRVFAAPHNFVTNFESITGEKLDVGDYKGPEGASVPSLGLSNKAVFTGDERRADLEEDTDCYFVPVNLTEPPTEETLMQNTLWPETHKLYGHGYEVFCLDASPDGTLLASACKATNIEHAAVLIWETSTWQQIQKLPSHQLTVTQLAFCPDSQRLLSVSRDRRWTLFQRRQGSNTFDTVASTDKTNGVHSRIIWCCAWAHDGEFFGTGSRDGKVCVWSKSETPSQNSLKDYAIYGKPLELANTSVTALAFAPFVSEGSRIIATGFETGVVRLYSFDGCWSLLYEMDKSAAHHLTVKRLTFQPKLYEDQNDKELLLASCGSDHLVRIYSYSVIVC